MQRPTKRERNDLFEATGEKGLDPAECELVFPVEFKDQAPTLRDAIDRVNERSSMTIRHVPTGSEFWVRFELARYGFQWEVASGPTSGAQNATKDWGNILEQVAYWAEEVKYVAETPDFWEELKRAPEILAAVGADASNARFTAEEQNAIARSIDGIRRLVRDQFELTSEQFAAIDQRLDDAEKASKRLGRKDWVMMFYGAVISTGMTDAVPSSVIQTVLATVVHGVAHLFGLGGPPPMITA